VMVTQYCDILGDGEEAEIGAGTNGDGGSDSDEGGGGEEIAHGQDDDDEEEEEEEEEEIENRNEDKELMMRQRMHRRARLCSVCRWEKGTNPGELKVPLDQMIDRDDELRIMVSLTNVEDLRSFVLSNLRTYMRPGGCALFLETILHIHGIPRITKMIRKSRKLSSNDKVPPLAACQCEQRQRRKWVDTIQQQSKATATTPSLSNMISVIEDQTPQGHECISTELLSLLLTGKVYTETVSWNADNLGIGLLSVNDMAEEGCISSSLKLPPKPIWLVRGDVSYSTLWNNNMKIGLKSHSFVDDDESDSLLLTHWNCWYNVPNKTEMRVVPSAKGEINIPPTVPKELPSSSEMKKVENPITIKEIDKTEIHVDDEQYYPENFRRWRFRFNFVAPEMKDTEDVHDDDEVHQSQKLPAWITYYRLDRRQKEIVERKLSPRINLAIWSKWPNATVDNVETRIYVPPVRKGILQT